MISRPVLFAYCAFLFAAPTTASAFCQVYSRDIIGEKFQYTYDCTNTQNAITYQIIRRITKTIDFEFFTFDPRGWGLMCSSLRLGADLIDQQCTQTGLKKPKKYMENGFAAKIHFSTDSNDLKQNYNRTDYSFVYPQHTQMYDAEGCAIFVQNKKFDLYSKTAGPENFGACLLEYERYLTGSQ
jgi:hypothetical protein